MTPKEKAIELVDKCYELFPLKRNVITFNGNLSWGYDNWEQSKICALIAVDELIQFGNESGIREPMMYWNDVKKEIKRL